MKKIIFIALIMLAVSVIAEPIVFVQCKPPYENNYTALLSPTQTSNFWGCVLYDPDLVLPECHTNSHIQGATILLTADGKTKINIIWMPDVPTNSNMMAKMKANSPINKLVK